MKRFPPLAVALLVLASPPAPAATPPPAAPVAAFASTVARTRLVELFTSEGCSSCPPAEERLSALVDDPGLWRAYVPVSFHVAYWDNLGWPDRFANRVFTGRQYALAATWRSNSVYTPCFVLDGTEWNGALSDGPPPPAGPAGVLRVDYAQDGSVHIAFAPVSPGANPAYEAHLALLGGGIVSPVRAGENAGRTLRHEFVVLALADVPLESEESFWQANATLVRPKPAGVGRYALAAWVTRRDELTPVQATGGWLK